MKAFKWTVGCTLLLCFTVTAVLSCCNLVISVLFLARYRLYLLTMAARLFLLSPLLLALSAAVSFLAGLAGLLAAHCCGSLRLRLQRPLAGLSCGLAVLTVAGGAAAAVLSAGATDALAGLSLANSTTLAGDWDPLQTAYQCCGGRGPAGYRDWNPASPAAFPDSCCTVKYPGCGAEGRPASASHSYKEWVQFSL